MELRRKLSAALLMALTSLSVWIPVAVAIGSIVLTVALGVVYQTHHFDKRFEQAEASWAARFQALERSWDKRMEDLEKRSVDRIERPEHPVHRS